QTCALPSETQAEQWAPEGLQDGVQRDQQHDHECGTGQIPPQPCLRTGAVAAALALSGGRGGLLGRRCRGGHSSLSSRSTAVMNSVEVSGVVSGSIAAGGCQVSCRPMETSL